MFKSIFNKIVEVNMRALGFDPESSLDRRLFEDYRLSPEERQAIYVSKNFLELLKIIQYRISGHYHWLPHLR